MGRRPQPEIKERLLEACADHALAHGLPDRLEPLARATGTSTRMLIYHFGTRDVLLRAVLERARQRQVTTFGDLLRMRPGEPYTGTLRNAWAFITGPEGQPYLQLLCGGWRRPTGSGRSRRDWAASAGRNSPRSSSPSSAVS